MELVSNKDIPAIEIQGSGAESGACVVCKSAEPIADASDAMKWQDGEEPRNAHGSCLHRARADESAQLVQQLKQLLAYSLAAQGGTLNVNAPHVKRAHASGLIVDVSTRPGGLRLRLGDKLPPPPAPEVIPAPPAEAAPEQAEV